MSRTGCTTTVARQPILAQLRHDLREGSEAGLATPRFSFSDTPLSTE